MSRFPVAVVLVLATAASAGAQVRVDEWGDPLPPGAKYRLGTNRLREVVRFGAAALSPDAATIAVYGSGTVRLVDVATGKEIKTLGATPTVGGMLQFSGDGKFLAASSYQETKVFNVATGETVLGVKHARQISGRTSQALSDTGERLAFIGSDAANPNKSQVLVWDVVKNKELMSAPVTLDFANTAKVAMSADGKTLAFLEYRRNVGVAADNKSVVKIWDIDANKETRTIEPAEAINNLVISPDGKLLAGAATGSTITVWTVADGVPLAHFAGGRLRGATAQFAFSPDSKRLAAMSNDGAAQIWSLAGNDRTGSDDRPVSQVYSMQFTKDGGLVGFGADGVAAVVWDVGTGKTRTPPITGHTQPVTALCFSKDGKSLISGGADTLVFWDLAAGKKTDQKIYLGEGEAVRRRPIGLQALTISPNGAFVSLVNVSAQNQIFDVATGKVAGVFDWRSFGTANMGAAFSADGSLIANVDAPGVVRLWTVQTGRALHTFLEPNQTIDDIAVSPDTALVAVACRPTNIPAIGGVAGARGGRIVFFDTKSGKAVREVESNAVNTFGRRIAFSPDSSLLAETRGNTNSVALIDVGAGRELGQIALTGGSAANNAPPAFSPDGRLLGLTSQVFTAKPGAVTTFLYGVHVYEVASKTPRLTLPGQESVIRSMKFSPDSQLIATGGNDSSILVWELNRPAEAKNPPTREELDAAWKTLTAAPAEPAHRAIKMLTANPAEAVAWIKENVKPVERAKSDGVNIEDLISKLGDETFLTRERATNQLAKIGAAALPALKKALAGGELNVEAKRRADHLLSQIAAVDFSVDRLQPLRAIEILERIGTQDSRAVLEALAAGEPSSYLTREAKGALGRLAR